MIDATVTLVGNLVDNPALRVTASGTSVCGFRLATTPRRFDRATGRWVGGATLFLRVSCWRQLAENVTASLSRGDRALVVGRLRQHSYLTQQGERRVSYEIDAEAVAAELAWYPVRVQRPARSEASSGVPDGQSSGAAEDPLAGSVDHAAAVATADAPVEADLTPLDAGRVGVAPGMDPPAAGLPGAEPSGAGLYGVGLPGVGLSGGADVTGLDPDIGGPDGPGGGLDGPGAMLPGSVGGGAPGIGMDAEGEDDIGLAGGGPGESSSGFGAGESESVTLSDVLGAAGSVSEVPPDGVGRAGEGRGEPGRHGKTSSRRGRAAGGATEVGEGPLAVTA